MDIFELSIFQSNLVQKYAYTKPSLYEMKADKNPEFEKYEPFVFKSTKYIFDNPENIKSKEFISGTQIIGFWMNKNTGMGIPTFGNFLFP